MSFWQSQPVKVSNDNIKQILSHTELLDKINGDIEKCKIKLDYNSYKGDDLLSAPLTELRSNILKFINNNYVNSDNLCLIYSDELFSYYLHDSIVIQFYPKGSPEKIIGIIIGKKKKLFLGTKDEPSDIIEVDFLCLLEKLRSMHLAPYMIGVLTKETVLQFNIATAYYTISDSIKSVSFGKKQLFHKPIQVENLMLANFFTDATVKNDKVKYERFFNSYRKVRKLTYINNEQNPSEELIAKIHDLVFEYSKKTYDIFDYKSKESIKMILKNKTFHNFLFYKDDVLIDYVCIYRLDSHNKINKYFYKNGYIYILGLKNTDLEYINDIMDSISGYCYDIKRNEMIETIDMITLTDIFPINQTEDYTKMKFLGGSGSLSYYIFNMNVHPIINKKNGLVTL